MTLDEFLKTLDEELRNWEKRSETQPKPEKAKPDVPEAMYKYMALFMTNGTAQNKAMITSVEALLKDPIFTHRLQSCLEYVIAITSSAVMSAQEENHET